VRPFIPLVALTWLTLLVQSVAAQTMEPSYDLPGNDSSADGSGLKEQTKLLQGAVQKRGKGDRTRYLTGFQEGRKSDKTSENAGQSLAPTRQSSALSDESAELIIAWDKWRNHFEHTVYARFNELLNGGDALYIAGVTLKLGNAPFIRYKMGTKAEFACEIDNQKQVHNLRITHSSGIASYDQLLLRSVRAVAGKSCLKFPKGSLREKVSESLEIKITPASHFYKSTYNDVEKVKL
jgi:hypothetical protein